MQSKQVTSLTNPDIKKVVGLRDRKHRDQTGLTIVEGKQEVLAAVEGNIEIKELYVCRDIFKDGGLVKRLSSHVVVNEVTKEVFAKIAYGDRMEGILAVCKTPKLTLKDLQLSENPLLVIVEQVEKPGNLGAILRSCDGAGAEALIISDKVMDVYNPNVIRASLGAIFNIPVVAATNDAVLEFLREKNIAVYASVLNADSLYTNVDYKKSCAIVLGSEEKGLSTFWQKNSSARIRIPMLGKSDSLNVSTSAAILLYEALRQRT